MSGRCNLCKVRDIEKVARSRRWCVTRLCSTWGMGGFEIYLHPKEVSITVLSEEERKQYWQMWVMAIGTLCECD